ncbi:hypothetical protein OG763_38310 [Streptomyces sp. NBC_01230]|uniref:hypothetical protein n=1 Tax=Streptomyces sp. NBC_01230 TaxID=2903784 RepID=UPI002E0D2DF5|nr:hypothetical protein OG763_38310 [Streptomyces sp. NBC_01230]
MHCTYGDHLATATHSYETAGGSTSYLCEGHADRFGYPQYLVQLKPSPWRTQYGYLVNSHTGDGASDPASDLWPFDEANTEWWLGILGNQDQYLLADAAWEPYRAHQTEVQGLTIECTRVTVLPIV